MTDEVQDAQPQEPVVSAEPVASESVSSVAPVTQQAEAVAPRPLQQTFSQKMVDKIVGTRVKEAYERAKQDAMNEYQASQAATSSMGGMPGVSQEQIRTLIQQEAYRMSNEAMANQIASNFTAKMSQGEAKYTDFKEKVDALNLSSHPQLVMWTEKLDNAADVMYDIANNPTKVAHILMLANGGFPDLAQKELQKLSSSIKTNEDAKKVPSVNEPLGQLKPSTIGTGDGSRSTVTDLRAQPWLYA